MRPNKSIGAPNNSKYSPNLNLLNENSSSIPFLPFLAPFSHLNFHISIIWKTTIDEGDENFAKGANAKKLTFIPSHALPLCESPKPIVDVIISPFSPRRREVRISAVKTRAQSEKRISWKMKVNSLREFHMRRAHVRLPTTTTTGEIVGNLLNFFDLVLAACFIESSSKPLLFNRKIFKINLIGSRKRAQRKMSLKTFITIFSSTKFQEYWRRKFDLLTKISLLRNVFRYQLTWGMTNSKQKAANSSLTYCEWLKFN